MVLLLLTFCLLLLPLWESVIVVCFVVRYFMSILVLQSSWWEERADCFAWFVFLVSRDGWAALPRGATGLSAVCDCGISWSYSLTIFVLSAQESRLIGAVLLSTQDLCCIWEMGKNNFKYTLVFWVLERAVSLRRFCLKRFTSSDKQVIFRLEKIV